MVIFPLFKGEQGFACNFGRRNNLSNNGLKNCGIEQSTSRKTWRVVSGFGSFGDDNGEHHHGNVNYHTECTLNRDSTLKLVSFICSWPVAPERSEETQLFYIALLANIEKASCKHQFVYCNVLTVFTNVIRINYLKLYCNNFLSI